MTSGPFAALHDMYPEVSSSMHLSEQEQALWLLDRFAPGEGVANVGIAADVDGEIRWWPMRSALEWVVGRHPRLRSLIRSEGDHPIRAVRPPGDTLVALDVRTSTPDQIDADLRTAAGRPFDLEHGPAVSVTVFDLGLAGQVLLLAGHHAVLDARSAGTVLSDLWLAYDSFLRTGAAPVGVPAPPVPAEPVPAAEDSLRFWDARTAGLDPAAMRLFGGHEPEDGAAPSFSGRRLQLPLSAATAHAVRELRRRLRLSDNVVLLSAYLLLLARHGAGPDLVVGVTTNNRQSAGDAAVGHFFSTLPVAVPIRPDDTVAEFFTRTRDELLAVLPHRAVSYEAVVRRRPERRADWRSPLFRQVFTFWQGTPASAALPARVRRVRQVDTGYSRVELEFTVGADQNGGWHLEASYALDAHDEGFVRRLAARYEKLLQEASADPAQIAYRLPMRTAADSVVPGSADSAVEWPAPPTVAEMFAEQVRERPESVAVEHGDGSVSYGELAARTRAWSTVLADSGVRDGDVVAVATARSATAAAVALAVWALGAAYLPLDPGHPDDRLRRQVTDAGAAAIVAEPELAGRLDVGCPLLLPGVGTDDPGPGRFDRAPRPESVAYVIYTSGSSGEPKGVRLTHRNLANVVRAFGCLLGSGPDRSMLWSTTFAFDISALELFLPLASGGRVVVADDDTRVRPDRFVDLVARSDVDVVQATPTTWRLVLPHAGDALSGRWLLTGGEPLSATLADRLLGTGGRVLNVYGPTETTIWSTAHRIEHPGDGRQPPVGRPIANTTVHVLDRYGDDCGVDVVGDVAISGAGVAAGYLGRPEATAAAFFAKPGAGPTYRTGDLGRWRPDGTLELLGRVDRQVKLHGHRVELGEVESVLEEHSAVTSAAVEVRDEGLVTEALAAFVVPAAEFDASEVHAHAASRLPAYAVPSTFTVLPALPVNSSGKVDHRALAAAPVDRGLRVDAPAAAAGPAGDDVEAFLIETWRELLAEPGIDAGSNFFLSGGQSLVAIAVSDRVNHRYGVDLPITTFFTHPTPRRMAGRIASLRSQVRQEAAR